jgi:hypothetical protein
MTRGRRYDAKAKMAMPAKKSTSEVTATTLETRHRFMTSFYFFASKSAGIERTIKLNLFPSVK